jgi:hypothetical protein
MTSIFTEEDKIKESIRVNDIKENNSMLGLPSALTTKGYSLSGEKINYDSSTFKTLLDDVNYYLEPTKEIGNANTKYELEILTYKLSIISGNEYSQGEVIGAMLINEFSRSWNRPNTYFNITKKSGKDFDKIVHQKLLLQHD